MQNGPLLFSTEVPNTLTFSDPHKMRVDVFLADLKTRLFDPDMVLPDGQVVRVDLAPFLQALITGDVMAVGACIFNDFGYHPLIPAVERLLTRDFCYELLSLGERRQSIWQLAQVGNVLETAQFNQSVEITTNWPVMNAKELKAAYAEARERVKLAKDFPEPITQQNARDIEVKIRKEYGAQAATLYSPKEVY